MWTCGTLAPRINCSHPLRWWYWVHIWEYFVIVNQIAICKLWLWWDLTLGQSKTICFAWLNNPWSWETQHFNNAEELAVKIKTITTFSGILSCRLIAQNLLHLENLSPSWELSLYSLPLPSLAGLPRLWYICLQLIHSLTDNFTYHNVSAYKYRQKRKQHE